MCGNGCYINKTFFGCIMYADDIILLSPSVMGLQYMLDSCVDFGSRNDIIFNSKKSVCLIVGNRDCVVKCNMSLGGSDLSWTSKLKYLGVHFIANKNLIVDVLPIKCKFYAALNSILCKCKSAAEPVKIQLIKSFCLPLLSYCAGAVELTNKSLNCLSVCWNDAFRKVFNYKRSESVKELLAYCNDIDFVHIYDMFRYKFLKSICRNCPFLTMLFNIVESQFCLLRTLMLKYGLQGCYNGVIIRSIFHEHFKDLILT
jgi:hypothetical protein